MKGCLDLSDYASDTLGSYGALHVTTNIYRRHTYKVYHQFVGETQMFRVGVAWEWNRITCQMNALQCEC
jgi:hypothetical protein